MDTPPILAIGSHPGLERRVHPLRSKHFCVIELVLILLCVALYFEAPAWTMWREGVRITGPTIEVKKERDSEWYRVTVRDPATELAYTASMEGDNHYLGERVTVVVHPTDPSRAWSLTNVYGGVAAQCGLLLTTIAYPIGALVRHRRRSGR